MKPLDFLEHFLPVIALLLERPANNNHIIKKCQAGFITNVPQDGLYQAFKYFGVLQRPKNTSVNCHIHCLLENVVFSLLWCKATRQEQLFKTRVEYDFDAASILRVSSDLDIEKHSLVVDTELKVSLLLPDEQDG
jgi:hypothetical protein